MPSHVFFTSSSPFSNESLTSTYTTYRQLTRSCHVPPGCHVVSRYFFDENPEDLTHQLVGVPGSIGNAHGHGPSINRDVQALLERDGILQASAPCYTSKGAPKYPQHVLNMAGPEQALNRHVAYATGRRRFPRSPRELAGQLHNILVRQKKSRVRLPRFVQSWIVAQQIEDISRIENSIQDCIYGSCISGSFIVFSGTKTG